MRLLLLFSVMQGLLIADETAVSVIDQMRAIDQVLDEGLTIRGVRKSSGRPGDELRRPGDFELQFTWQAPVNAIILRSAHPPTLAVDTIDFERFPPGDPYAAKIPRYGLMESPGGDVTVSMPLEQIVYFGEDRSASLNVDTVFQVFPNGSYEIAGKSRRINVANADAATWSLRYKQALWCSGRLLTRFLDDVVQIEDAGSTVTLTASGRHNSATGGSWELTLDPGAGYLVRQGRFQIGSTPVYSFVNRGTITAGALTFAESAEFTTHATGMVDQFEFAEVSLEADRELLLEAADLVSDTSTPYTQIRDARPKSAILSQVDADGELFQFGDDSRPEEAPIADAPSGFRWWLLLINVLLVITWAIVFAVRKMRRPPSST